jgi:hypothetical protein
MDPEQFSNFRLAATFSYHSQRFLLLNWRKREFSVTPPAFCPGARNAQLRSFLDHLALKLRETREHVHHQLAGCRLCLDMLSQALETCASILNLR